MPVPTPEEAQRQRDRALAWIQQRWRGNQACPVCLSTTWTVTDVQEIRPFFGGDVIFGPGPLIPVFFVVCNTCGNSLMFNAIIAGVVEPIPPAPTPQPSEPEAQS